MIEADKYDYWLADVLEGTVLVFEYATNTDLRFAIMPYEAFLIFAEKTSERLAQQASFENEVRGLSWKYYEVSNEGSQNESFTIPASGKYTFLILRPSNPILRLRVSVSKIPQQPLESRVAELEKITANYGIQITNLISNFSSIQNSNMQNNEINTIQGDYIKTNQLNDIKTDIGQINGKVNNQIGEIRNELQSFKPTLSIGVGLSLLSTTGLAVTGLFITIKRVLKRRREETQNNSTKV